MNTMSAFVAAVVISPVLWGVAQIVSADNKNDGAAKPAAVAPAAVQEVQTVDNDLEERIANVHALLVDQLFEDASAAALELFRQYPSARTADLVMRCNRNFTDLLRNRRKNTGITTFNKKAHNEGSAAALVITRLNPDYAVETVHYYEVQIAALVDFSKALSDVIQLKTDPAKPGVRASREDAQELRRIKREVETCITQATNERSRFISYDVLSPYFADAYRTAFIARGIFNDDEDGLMRAAGALSAGCMKPNWLLEATQDVKDQYCETVAYTRENLSPDEWKHVQIRTSINGIPHDDMVERLRNGKR